MKQISRFLTENMYIVAAALYVLGIFLKAVPKIPNWVIPFALTAVGMGFGALILGAPQGILQGRPFRSNGKGGFFVFIFHGHSPDNRTYVRLY